MSNYPLFSAPKTTRSRMSSDARDSFQESPRAYDLDEYLDHLCQVDKRSFVDDPEFAEAYGLPINSLTEDDLRFLRDFILSSAMYVEQLEAFLSDTSDDFWEAREQAYRIITALLIRHYEYELEG
jgi:hypothetical protein